MDNIGKTSKHYKNISSISVSILIVFLQAYLMLIFSGIDLYNFSMLENNMIEKNVLQIFIQLVLFSIIYFIIYISVKKVYCFFWKINNKNSWVRGTWLHIHVKNDLRIGTVEIKQNFNTINAKGHNITPKGQRSNLNKSDTTWTYILCKVIDDKTVRDFVGCYTAQDIKNQATKDGMHVLQILGVDNKTGYANRMVGGFRDTFRIDGEISSDIGDHVGQLFFFRISDKCKKYLYDDKIFRYDKLSDMHEKPEFATEPYVIKLKECIDSMTEKSIK